MINYSSEILLNVHRYLGEMSQPCCIKAPSENQSELKIPKSLVCSGASFSFCWFWFWAGENPERQNRKHKQMRTLSEEWK